MQRLNPEQMVNMVGVEYFLLHAMEPILYVIRKQHRQSPTTVTPLADYYIIAGVVYQAPDLISVINARLLNAVHNLESAFDEARSYSQYHPSKGYWWQFKQTEQTEKADSKEKKRKKEEPGSVFQRQRVDMLLSELANKFPAKSQPSIQQPPPPTVVAPVSDKPDDAIKVEPKVEVKLEKLTDRQNVNQAASSRPPPEKKPKLIR
jgi:mediator of RNA polymerase II transcription subunit 6